ncbi:hypothetical protein CK203_106729 [Vitis vinifera]|uniref:Defensin-like protein n=1 Tax=Vitis vinifera TaxID=29760 RepID=A0A438FGF8_VITVI|nr:hypothetical protein CK203_106729 [Vitis vinifera]
MVGVVRGDPCIEGLGLCGHDCAQRCTKLHPGGEGSCEVTGNVPLCTCYYECPLPPPSPPKPKPATAQGIPVLFNVGMTVAIRTVVSSIRMVLDTVKTLECPLYCVNVNIHASHLINTSSV